MFRKTAVLSACLAALAAPACAKPLPAGVAAMVRAAVAQNDPTALAAVVRVAKAVNPDCASEIDALAKAPPGAGLGILTLKGKGLTIAAPPPPRGWKGSAELGGGLSTGATQAASGYGALKLTRIHGRWHDQLDARGDYAKTDGQTSNERLSMSYEPRLDLSHVTYAYGLTQFEHDKIQGYEARYTVGAGLGLELAHAQALKLALDFGPAVRVTHHYLTGEDTSVAARGSVNLKWLPTQRVTISEESDLYADDGETSAKSLTSLDTLLFGPLKARLSYDMHYEKNPTVLGPKLATETRAALVYTF